MALDEAFSAARPGLAAKLQDPAFFGLGPAGLFHRPLIVPVALSDGAGKALDAAAAEEKRSGSPAILIASPLIAKAILANGTWTGDPALLVPEWPGETLPGQAPSGLWTAITDPLPAYKAAGSAAGAVLAALGKAGGTPSCGVLFSEAPSRPRAALDAFAAAYAEASGSLPLKIRELSEGGTDNPISGQPRGAAGAPSSEGATQAAVAELLGSDIRVLFIALGSASGAAIKAAARPGLAIGADFPVPEPPETLAFRIFPDDDAIAKALADERRSILVRIRERGGIPRPGDGAGETKDLPALIAAGPSAKAIRVGGRDFGYFLSEALKRWP